MHVFGYPVGGQDPPKTVSEKSTEKAAEKPKELSFDLGAE